MDRFRRPNWSVALLLLMFGSQVIAQVTTQTPNTNQEQVAQPEQDLRDVIESLDLNLDEQPLKSEEQEVASLISQRVSSTEWLGALAPVALSPFFGLTCLSGIAIVGEDRLPEDHYLRRASSPLRNPLVFLTFLLLTILTSIPKFSKVSKPFAQACDQLETYSALVILLVIRFMGSMDVGPGGEEQVAVVYQAGFIEFSAESLLMLATIVNVIVINTVKFFFEILIWITPVPFIDAIFEASNKAACAVLAGIYAYSPTAATIINLLLLAACLLAFRWVKRREIYYRSVLFDFVRSWLGFGRELSENKSITVFPKSDVGKIPKLARCEFSATDGGWELVMPRMLRPAIRKSLSGPVPSIKAGLLMNSFSLDGVQFDFGKRNLAPLAEACNLNYDRTSKETKTSRGLPVELT